MGDDYEQFLKSHIAELEKSLRVEKRMFKFLWLFGIVLTLWNLQVTAVNGAQAHQLKECTAFVEATR